MQSALPRLVRPLLLAALLSSPASQAQQALLDEAQQLSTGGNHDAALARVEQYLRNRPGDARGRFLKGVLLVEAGRDEAAIVEFERLASEHPELPEPYNNLAVLYASRGQYEAARDALLRAINTHPSYAIAHENLGDIYARLAGIAYDRALLLDGDNPAARSKLALVHDLFSDNTPAETPTQVASAQPAPAPAAPPVEPASTTVDTAPLVPAQTPVQAAVTPPSPPEAPLSAPEVAVRDAVLDWARAWSTQDVPAYLAAYGRTFQPPGGVSRAAWEDEREQRLRAPAFIELGIDDLSVEMRGVDRARAVFTQSYRSDTYADRVRKVLGLARQGARWQIISEVSD